MYLQIYTDKTDERFSWILCKHPDNVFEREDNGHQITGKFIAPNIYEMTVRTDLPKFTAKLKGQNEPFYVRAEQWLVCPSTLRGMMTAFRSALNETSSEEQPKIQFVAKMGPFPITNINDISIWSEVGILAERTRYTETVSDYTFLAKQPMTLSEFLQKLYVVSLALTSKFQVIKTSVSNEQVEKYIRLTSKWLSDSDSRWFILRRLAGYKAGAQAKLEKAIPDTREDKEEPVTKEIESESLHQLRHKKILEILKEFDPKTVLDLGASEGKLSTALAEEFPACFVRAVETDDRKINRIRTKLKKVRTDSDTYEVHHENLIWPKHWFKPADAIVCSEVIEHMVLKDRERLIQHVMSLEPKVFVLTTPNVAYNANYGLEPGQFRHNDHKIEYAHEQLQQEVLGPLSEKFDVELVALREEEIQSSFVVKATLRAKETDAPEPDNRRRRSEKKRLPNFDYMFHGMYLPHTNVTVTPRMVSSGITSNAFVQNSNDIFYLGPTIAPVDHHEDFPEYLEHPMSAFQYYSKRGIHYLVEQEKLMGSRAYVLLVKGERPIVNSRSGMSFGLPEEFLAALQAEIEPKMTTDFMVLDAEILPWAFKADRLIREDFQRPGEASLLWREKHGTAAEQMRSIQFLESLSNYNKPAPLTLHPFTILARGNIKKGRYADTKLSFFEDQYILCTDLQNLAGTIVKPVATNIIDIDKYSHHIGESIDRWEKYCASGGEGFVYKTVTGVEYHTSGFLQQPALKVRGRDYLRIIYGIDYLEPEQLKHLTQRNTQRKRVFAAQEQEIAMQILMAFVNGKEHERLRAVAAFVSLDQVAGQMVDKTL